MYVLIIEDNPDLAANIGDYLQSKGHIVDYAGDGLTGLHLACQNSYDAILLDLFLPGLDGLSLCQRLRTDHNVETPILMLTARDQEQDKLQGFAAGTDDYLTKPFSLQELLARLQALVRRSQGGTQNVLRISDLTLDCRTLRVTRDERELQLTPTGLKLLEKLMRVSPSVVSRADIERLLWGDQPPDNDATLRAHIYALRTAIDQGHDEKLLHTIHGIGYRLAPNT